MVGLEKKLTGLSKRWRGSENAMNYRFQKLLGAPCRGGNAAITQNIQLISLVGNRVSVTDLNQHHSVTLLVNSSSNICRLAASPDDTFLLAVDEENRCFFINVSRRVILHRMTFNGKVGDLKFSPNCIFIAVGMAKLVQIWLSPGFRRAVLPFELVRTFANSDDEVGTLDSDYLLVGSKDLTARLFCVRKLNGELFLFLGHRDSVVGCFFGVDKMTNKVNRAFTIARDGFIFSWGYSGKEINFNESEDDHSVENDTDFKNRKEYQGKDRESEDVRETDEEYMDRGKWVLLRKDGFHQESAKVAACDYHEGLDMVVVGFSDGVIGLYQMPDFTCIHLLSIWREKLTTAVFNVRGNWLTFGCAKLIQFLVSQWPSESYLLKQKGHYFDVNCVTYSPDSHFFATGAVDNKVKVWNVMSGSFFITFTDHTNAVTALYFMADNHSLLTASLDGTVRAWDFKRYKNYKTYTTPTARQFVSLKADPRGDFVCAATLDSFEIFVWSKKIGQIKDILSGHETPVNGLMFSSLTHVLASSSWDNTVRLWDVFASKGTLETSQHNNDVVTVAFRPDGKQLASSTLDGQIHFWDTIEGVLMYTIKGGRDISGGWLMTDRRSAANSCSGKCITTLCYSADGGYILAAGTSRYICMSDILDQMVSFLTCLLKGCAKYTIMLLLLPRTSSAEDQHQGEENSVSYSWTWTLVFLVIGGFFPVVMRFLWSIFQNTTPTKKKKKKKKRVTIASTTQPDSPNGQGSISNDNQENTFDEKEFEDPFLDSEMVALRQTVPNAVWTTVGKLSLSDKILGVSGDLTMALGFFEKRPVIIKYGPQSDAMENEIKVLIESDFHPNIVRYFSSEKSEDSVLYCFERWQCNLGELVEIGQPESPETLENIVEESDLWTATGVPKQLLISLIRDVVLAIEYLHGVDIIHRDLTPQSVMIMLNGNSLTAKIDDMRIAGAEQEEQLLSNYVGGEKFLGYKPLDQSNYGRETNKVDMFSFGILMFYVITQRKHPFSCGGIASIEENIQNDLKNFDAISNFPEAAHLIPLLVELDPVNRPNATDVLRHPFFWSCHWKLLFIGEVSDHVYGRFLLQSDLENTFARVVGVGALSWDTKLDFAFFTYINQVNVKPKPTTKVPPKYNYSTICDLVRLIRNTQHHLRELPPQIKPLFPDGVYNYFDQRFPRLFMEVYCVVIRQCKQDQEFERFFNELPPFEKVQL